MLPASGSEFDFVYFSSIHKRRYDKRNIMLTRTSPGELLVVVAQGAGHLYAGQLTAPVKPGMCIWLMPGQTFDVLQESDTLEVYLLAVRELAVARRQGGWSCSPQTAKPPGRLNAVMMKPMLEGIKRLYEESRDGRAAGAGLQMRLQGLLYELKEQLGAQHESGEAVGIDRTLSYMHKHYREKIKLETLSDLVGLTPTSYSRSFKKAKKMSPVEYLNRIRIDYAKRLLEQPGCSVKAAASAVGMGSEFYFSRMFKKTVGLPPTLYVKRRQLKVASASCFRYKDCLLSLGVEDAFELNGYLSIQTGEDERVVELQLEQMREFGPDVIVADARHLSLYERLRQIAPTVVLRLSMDWRKGYMQLAELVGREAEARSNCLQLADRVSLARERLSHTIGIKTISLIRLMHNGNVRVQGKVDHPLNDLLYAELGLQPGSCVPRDRRIKEVALESLTSLETDYLLVCDNAEADRRLLKGAQWRQAAGGTQSREPRLIPNWVSMSWAPSGQHQIIDMLEQWED
ncbi:AraC family transcriptional regulator [Bacillus sp. 3255]|uniref:AraC family transcriptional regulator n=1 Tax=Bacillus sp. 3255 TaxID=2817904 RepID=UPI0028641432|nr:AraC family transcriptional regulator [Bacillus sp. 3255]MDR6882887.1 AraC-like DNA-binding protein [Bacillus sp. 3255]